MIVRYKTSKIKLKDEEFYYLVQNSVIENHILKEIKSINQMIIDFISNNCNYFW